MKVECLLLLMTYSVKLFKSDFIVNNFVKYLVDSSSNSLKIESNNNYTVVSKVHCFVIAIHNQKYAINFDESTNQCWIGYPTSHGEIEINYIERDFYISNFRLPKLLIMGGHDAPLPPSELIDLETGQKCDFIDNDYRRFYVQMALTDDDEGIALCGGAYNDRNCQILKTDGSWDIKTGFFATSKYRIASTIVPNFGWFLTGSSEATTRTDLIDLTTFTVTQGPNLMYGNVMQPSTLQINDSHTLLIGGRLGESFTTETWFYDWTKGLTGSWTKYHNLNQIRAALSAGVNDEGLVLAVGGYDSAQLPIQTMEKINFHTRL